MLEKTYVALDLETTGTIPNLHEIIEIGAVKITKGKITEHFQSFVKPTNKIPLFIQNLTNITDEMVVDAPGPDTILPALKKFIGRNPIIGHNIDFDLGFINHQLKTPLKNKTFDTLPLARIFLPTQKSHSLSKLTEELNIKHTEKHRAFEDAMATAMLFIHFQNLIKTFDYDLVMAIKDIAGDYEWPGKLILAVMEKELAKTFPANKVTNRYFTPQLEEVESGLFAAPEPARDDITFPVLLDYQHMKSLLKEDGLLSKKFPGFERRPQQEKVLLDICRSFNESKILLMEAGTGAGKSLSYLIPSIYWSVYNRSKVVIATHTINLQEQLWQKDIPLLRNILDTDFRVALVKGRQNYICLRKWEEIINENYSQEEMLFYLRLLIWLRTTKTGDKSELNLNQLEKEYWSYIAAESETCLGPQCPWFDNNCFVMHARRYAESADILIVNHSLLFADIKTDNKVLPHFNLLIMDEAHHLEDGATEHLGVEVSSTAINRLLFSLHKSSNGNPGFLHHLKNKLNKYLYIFDTLDYNQVLNEIQLAIENIYSIKEVADLFFQIISALGRKNMNSPEEAERITYRLKTNLQDEKKWPEIDNQRANLQARANYLIENLKKIIKIIERQSTGEEEILVGEKKELIGTITNLKETMANIDMIVGQEEKNHVYWLEIASGFCSLRAAPINVGEIIYGNLLQNLKTVVFSSATLAIDGDFTHFIDRVGLNNFTADKFMQTCVNSPFDYEKQALLCAVNDLPEPVGIDDITYAEAIVPFLTNLIRITKGRTLVLFTSHKMLKDVYQRIKPAAEKYNINLLGHGIDGGRNRILEQFKEHNNSILFGANSFWEGIDLPGDLLKCVVIIKIPFWPPAIPTIEARLDDLAAKKIDGFWNYSIPQAVIRFKQGFGRLIRSNKDSGVVVILDSRIINRKYGYKFLRSLPLKHHFKGEQDIVLQKISDWLSGIVPPTTINTYDSKEQVKNYLNKIL